MKVCAIVRTLHVVFGSCESVRSNYLKLQCTSSTLAVVGPYYDFRVTDVYYRLWVSDKVN